MGLLRAAAIVPVAILLLVMFQPAGGAHQAPQTAFAAAGATTQGDVDCNGTADSIDALQVLRSVASLPVSADCLAQAADVDCSTQVDSIDGLLILRFVASLPVNTPTGCTPIGDALGPLSPQVLAAQLYAATDSAQAEALLRRVYSELGVGLYTGDGQQILAGAETGPDNFYLYDSESELLARNYVDRQLFRLDTATLFLNEAGVLNSGGQAMTAADVLSVLTAKVTAARGDESLFTWRLIDELGLAREDPLDLAAPGLDPAATYLDSVQTFMILYDMTLGLPVSAGASTEVPSAGDSPDARTKALHDYSLLAQGYSAYGYPVAPTHWKHDASTVAEERTLRVNLHFLPGDKVMQGFTAGPLTEVALPQGGDVEGADVSWVSSTLIPKNGAWRELANTDRTNADGDASIVFVPKTECAPGEGPVQAETYTVFVVVSSSVKSAFWPHRSLGQISWLVKTKIEVSRHTGSSPLAAGGAASTLAASGATADGQTPCAYEGTASATQVYEGLTWTATASDLRFELKPRAGLLLYPRYELVRGNVTVQASGTRLGCTLSGGFSIPAPIDDGVHGFGGYILVDVQKSEYSAAGTAADQEGHLNHCSPRQLDGQYGLSWLSMMGSPGGRSFTPGGALEGSDDFTDPFYHISVHSQWSLHPAECQPSPEPVCQ